jgi:hypothetical protein
MILKGLLNNKKKISEYLDTIIDDHRTGQNYEVRQLSKFPNNGFKEMLYIKFSKMEELTDDYAHLIISKNSEKEMKMLTKNDGTRIIMVISTIFCDDVPDSSVAFYSTDWKPLRTLDYYTLPPINNFRKVAVDKTTSRLTVTTTNAPFMLSTDGSNEPQKPFSATNTFRWSTEESRYILEINQAP